MFSISLEFTLVVYGTAKPIIWYLLFSLPIIIRSDLPVSMIWSVWTEKFYTIMWLSFSTITSGWCSCQFSFTLKPNLWHTFQSRWILLPIEWWGCLYAFNANIHRLCGLLSHQFALYLLSICDLSILAFSAFILTVCSCTANMRDNVILFAKSSFTESHLSGSAIVFAEKKTKKKLTLELLSFLNMSCHFTLCYFTATVPPHFTLVYPHPLYMQLSEAIH